jgi:hypothetical protein
MIEGNRILWGAMLGTIALITGGLAIAATPEKGDGVKNA